MNWTKKFSQIWKLKRFYSERLKTWLYCLDFRHIFLRESSKWSWCEALLLFLKYSERSYIRRAVSWRHQQTSTFRSFIQHFTLSTSAETAGEFIQARLLFPLIKFAPRPIVLLYGEWRDICRSRPYERRRRVVLLSKLSHISLQNEIITLPTSILLENIYVWKF